MIDMLNAKCVKSGTKYLYSFELRATLTFNPLASKENSITVTIRDHALNNAVKSSKKRSSSVQSSQYKSRLFNLN